MPFHIKKRENGKWGVQYIKTKKWAKKEFNSKESALNMAKRWMEYRGEKPVIKGNRVISSK